MGKRIAFSINEAAKATGLSKYAIIDAYRDGEVQGRREGQALLIDVQSLEGWLTDQGTRTTALVQLLSLRDRALQDASELHDGAWPALVNEAG